MGLSGGVCDTRCQAFFTSVIEKENAIRRKWFLQNEEKLVKKLEEEDIKLAQELENLKTFSEERKKSKKIKKSREKIKKQDKEKLSSTWRPVKTEALDISIMRPIEPKKRNILYQDGVATYIATNQYLHERFKEKPEDRFYYPQCTSWNYGWRLKDHPPIPSSEVGIRSIIQTSFYSRHASGLIRDPDWYKICQTNNPKNFNEILTY